MPIRIEPLRAKASRSAMTWARVGSWLPVDWTNSGRSSPLIRPGLPAVFQRTASAATTARLTALDEVSICGYLQCAYLANVVMRLPAWYAAHDEVRGHISAARNAPPAETGAHFAAAFARFGAAGHPIDAARCAQLAVQASNR